MPHTRAMRITICPAALTAVVACAHPLIRVAPPAPGAPAVQERLAAPLAYALTVVPAVSYNEPFAAQIDDGGLTARLTALVPPGAALVRDPRLDVTARELVPLAIQGATPSPALVEHALHLHGVVESGRAYVGRGPTADAQLAALAPVLVARLAYANTRIGIAIAPGLAVAVVAYTSAVTIVSAPREATDRAVLEAILAPPFEVPHVHVTHEDHAVDALALTVARDGAGLFRASFACAGHTGPQWVAIDADDHAEPLATFPISCAKPAPVDYLVEPDANLTTPDVARRLAALINRERTAAGLAPLVPDGPATAAAEQYATVMAQAHAVVHDLGHTTPEQRLARAGRVPIVVAESTLKADNFGQAMEVMLNDAAYRRQVADRTVTHMGLGVVRDRSGELYIAIEYEQLTPAIDLAALEARARDQLFAGTATRRTAYRGNKIARDLRAPPALDTDLSRIAREAAANIALGWAPDAVAVLLHRRFQNEDRRFDELKQLTVLVTDAAAVDVSHLLDPDQIIDNIGVGAAQSSGGGPLSGRAYIVVVTGRYRGVR